MAVMDGWSALLWTTQMLKPASAAAAANGYQAMVAAANAATAPARIGSKCFICELSLFAGCSSETGVALGLSFVFNGSRSRPPT
jgi:hypothetical protein